MSECIKTRFKVTTRIDKCTNAEHIRYDLDAIHCMQSEAAGEVYLTAIDGNLVAINRVEGTTDETKYVPPKVVPAVNGGGYVNQNSRWENERQSKVADNVDHEGRYPNIAEVLDLGTNRLEGSYRAENGDLVETMSVTLNADLLRNLLGACISAGNTRTRDVTLHVRGPKNGVFVDGPDGFGVIMPMGRNNRSDTTDPIETLRGKIDAYVASWKERGAIEDF